MWLKELRGKIRASLNKPFDVTDRRKPKAGVNLQAWLAGSSVEGGYAASTFSMKTLSGP
jgi:hypothetical protein